MKAGVLDRRGSHLSTIVVSIYRSLASLPPARAPSLAARWLHELQSAFGSTATHGHAARSRIRHAGGRAGRAAGRSSAPNVIRTAWLINDRLQARPRFICVCHRENRLT